MRSVIHLGADSERRQFLLSDTMYSRRRIWSMFFSASFSASLASVVGAGRDV